MEEFTAVSKLKINEDIYFLKSVWTNDINLTLISGDKIWTGTFSEDRMKHFYTNLNVSKDQYLKNVKQALCEKSTNENFLVDFADGVLTWKMVIDEKNNIKCLHGKVNLENYFPIGGTEFIADTLIEMKESAEKSLETKDVELEEISAQLKSVVDKLMESKNLKCKMEEDLVSKFIAILNSKKQKISQMEEFIHANWKDPSNEDRRPLNFHRSIKQRSSDSE